MVELAMNYETLVRDLAQVQPQADTLREQAISGAPIDPAASGSACHPSRRASKRCTTDSRPPATR